MKSKRLVSGMLWRFGERICAQLVSFFVSVVLARILLPSEYGIIAMTTVFITICNVFVTSGFGMALIQKKDVDDLDFSTILVFGFIFSIVLYVLLFIFAPTIADFYQEPILIPVLRIMSLKLPLAAINSVQQAFVSRKMLFRKFFWATLVGTVTSGVVGIVMAYQGCGVWALVGQYLINSLMDTIILGISIRWFPKIEFSANRLKSMIGFGWRILVSDLINTIYNELRSMIIGKRYTSEELAYYNKGQQIPHLFITNVGVAISGVLFPAMAMEQTDRGNLKQIVNKSISVGTYIIFPIMIGLAVVAKPIIILLLTEKWLLAVPFLQMACFSFAFEPWSTANLQAIKATGEAGKYLKVEIVKKSIALVILFISVPFGVHAIAASACIYSFIAIILTATINDNNIGYGFFQQLKDILPNILCALIMGGIVYLVGFFNLQTSVGLCIQIAVGIVAYFASSYIFRNNNLNYMYSLIYSLIKNKRSVENE